MDKMELLCDVSLWSRAIEHGIEKKISKPFLSLVSNPHGRLAIIEAIESGRYEIEPPRIVEIPKPNGKMREVYVNSPMDRVVLSLVNEMYCSIYKGMIHEKCVSYKKGISVPIIIHSLIKKLSEGYVGYKVDISKYFDSVNKETLFKTLQCVSTNSPLDEMLLKYYSDDRVLIGGKIVERYKSIAQGCAFGTFLANLVLSDVDAELDKMDIIYLRYSDDILMLGEDAGKALNRLGEMLSTKGLELNPKKVEKIKKDSEFTFLGAKIKEKEIDISDESVNRFKNKIRSITKTRKNVQIHNRASQIRAIKKINSYLREGYMKDSRQFGWEKYFFSLVNTNKTIIMLDEFVKDRLKMVYTGKGNHTTNMHKTSNEQLKEMGYKSLNHLYQLHCISKDVYNAEICKV